MVFNIFYDKFFSIPFNSVTRSMSRNLRRFQLTESVFNAYVKIKPNPRAEVYAALSIPPRRITRRDSVPAMAFNQAVSTVYHNTVTKICSK